MAHTPPTAAQLKARYPAFDSVSTDVVTAAISDAGRWVDNSWTEGDYANAIMLLACHFMYQEGLLHTGGGASPAVSGPVTSRSLGDASVSYASPGASGVKDYSSLDLQRTIYGQRFAAMRRANHPGILTV